MSVKGGGALAPSGIFSDYSTMPENPDPVDVFQYVDYRLFLKDQYRERKHRNPRFSHRFIANQVRTSSTGWFADVVKGRSNLSGAQTLGLIRLLGLTPGRAEYFTTLVQYQQAGSVEEKCLHYRKLIALKGAKPDLVGKNQFEYYAAWHHSAIRELLFFYDFQGDFAALARKLQPGITTQQAKASIRLLEDLGFIRKEASGRYRPLPATLKKDPAFKTLHLANILRTQAALGVESLEAHPKEERDISSMTISLSGEGLRRAQEELRVMRQRLLALTDEDDKPSKVYQCNFHLFPVSR